jgi:histone acetyltransferase 1
MRPFIIWYVDGANFVDDLDDKWDVFMLFKVPKEADKAWCLAGYVTCYSFFAWSGKSDKKDAAEKPLERAPSMQGPQQVAPNVEAVVSSIVTNAYDRIADSAPRWYERRFRISQFLIFPLFQRSGHGAKLFHIIYNWALSHYHPLRDITVEDPSPGFVGLRDFCDLQFLMEKNLLEGKVGNDQDAIAGALRARHTCQPQINRVLQLVQWMEARAAGAAEMDRMRIVIKQRLYKENSADIPDTEVKPILAQLWQDEQASFDATLKRLKLINI